MAESILSEVEDRLEELNRKDPSIKRSMASGFAFRSEVAENDGHAVYLLADERMYEKKRSMKTAG